MFQSLKIKSIGLGVACMAFSLSSAAHASIIPVDNCKYGKNDGCELRTDVKDIQCDVKDIDCELKTLSFDDKHDHKKGEKFKIEKLEKEIKCEVKDLTCDLKQLDHETCNKEVRCEVKDILCDLSKVKHEDGCKAYWTWKDINCDIKTLACDVYHLGNGCGHDPAPCQAVPAPASSAMSGLGLLGVALMGWKKARRLANA